MAQQLLNFIIAKFDPSKRILYIIPWFISNRDIIINLGNRRTILYLRALGVNLIEYFSLSNSATKEPH